MEVIAWETELGFAVHMVNKLSECFPRTPARASRSRHPVGSHSASTRGKDQDSIASPSRDKGYFKLTGNSLCRG
jgi:hypothetical protein